MANRAALNSEDPDLAEAVEEAEIAEASEYLETEDLLEMVNAGLIPMVVVDDHKARFWGQIFENISDYQGEPDIGGCIASVESKAGNVNGDNLSSQDEIGAFLGFGNLQRTGFLEPLQQFLIDLGVELQVTGSVFPGGHVNRLVWTGVDIGVAISASRKQNGDSHTEENPANKQFQTVTPYLFFEKST